MRLARPVRLLPMFLIGAMLLMAENEAKSQKNRLPSPRPKIFLNNNGSLYTYPNPNFGLPSQLAHSFTAVASEDCRLFNNGATIMPQFRLLAGECDQLANNMNNNNGGGVLPGGFVPLGICPLDGLPIFDDFTHPPFPHTHVGACFGVVPPIVGPPFGGVPGFGGVNYQRNRPGGYYPSYPGANGSNYDSYNPNAAAATMTTASSAYHPTPAGGWGNSRSYRGFGSYSDSNFGGFMASVGTEPTAQFGGGFAKKLCQPCDGCEETGSKSNSASSEPETTEK